MAGKLNPIPYWMRIGDGCPCDRCFQRKDCKTECHRFAAWLRTPVRAGIRSKAVAS